MKRNERWVLIFPVLMAVSMFSVQPATAQTRTNYWTGAAESDNHWSTAGNWSLLEAPAEGDRVVFGNDPDGVAQVITLDVEPTIHELWVSTTNTSYTINAADNERIILTGGIYAVRMTSETTQAPLLNTRMFFSNTVSEARINNDSLAARLVLGPAGVISANFSSTYYGFAGAGYIESLATIGSRSRIRGNVILTPAAGNATSTHIYLGQGSTLLLATNAVMGGRFESLSGTTSANLAIIDSGAADRTMSIRNEQIRGAANMALVFADSPDGSTGHLTVQFYSMNANSMWFDTSANSTVELSFFAPSPAAAASMQSADNPGIGGAGNMRLKRNDPGHSFGIARAMTYTGRTMLETGILQLNTGGALPTNTIVEIGSSASFNLNGQASLVGGLSDYEGTAGQILLNGGTLTVNAQLDSGFSGTFTGTGAVIKAGAAALTLSNDFTQVAGRTLRVEDGLLAVTGALSVAAGTFELAGGRLTAGSLASEGNAWNVTLHESDEDQVLVDVAGNADITSATLVLGLADGYKPEYGKEYTLLYAGSITGAGAGGLLFGIEDGDSFVQNGQEYMIRWENGSEQIILTAIPEPGSFALLALAGSCLWFKRRRRRG